MTPNELRACMSAIGLTTSDVGLICGLTDRQVRHWLTGAHAVPRSAVILLEGLRANVIDRDWVTDVVMNELRKESAALEGSN